MTDEAPVTETLYRYDFYCRQGAAVTQLPIMVISPKDIDSAEVRQAIDLARGQLAQQPNVGMVPRPRYYTKAELHELSATDADDAAHEAAAKKPAMLILPGRENGRA